MQSATHSYTNDTEEEDGKNETIKEVGATANDGPNNERISNTSTTFATIPNLSSTIVIDARSVLGPTNNSVSSEKRKLYR